MRGTLRFALSLVVGFALTSATGAGLVFYRLATQGIEIQLLATTLAHPRDGSHRIALLTSPAGSSPFETLAPLSLLSQKLGPDWAIDIVLYHSSPAAARVGAGLLLKPHHLLTDDLPRYDAVIVPPLAASEDQALWIVFQNFLKKSPYVVAFGESARFLALATGPNPTLKGPPAANRPRMAAPYASSKEVAKAFPEVQWISDTRVVSSRIRQQTLITSPGSGATLDAIQTLVSALKHQEAPQDRPELPHAIPRLTPVDFAGWIRWVGFQPRPTEALLALTPGTQELGLATLTDLLGKSGRVHLTPVVMADETTSGDTITWTLSAHGFEIGALPQKPIPEAQVLLLLPQATQEQSDNPLMRAQIQQLILEHHVPPKSFFHVKESELEVESLSLLHYLWGAGSESFVAHFAERNLMAEPALSEMPRNWGSVTFPLFLTALYTSLFFALLSFIGSRNPLKSELKSRHGQKKR